ncbi:MAG TPA: hypothetical protein VKU41_29470 [Polyangiaceae bacterium]|nr:hypothetical protein [Polyangiaceae bacterium]
MNNTRTLLFAGGIVAAMFVGGFLGATAIAKSPITAASAALTASSPSPAFKSNETSSHEAGESAAREAAENNGTFHPGGPGGFGPGFKPNEDPTHEAGESAAREAQENAAAKASPTP